MSETENERKRHVDPLHLITVILIIIAVILLIILIIPRPKEKDDKAAVSTATPVTETGTKNSSGKSDASTVKNANVVTDFDKQAVASAINQDLVEKLGQENIKYVTANDLTLSKENNVIKATGNYQSNANGRWSAKGLSYTYKITDDEYELVDADISQDAKKKNKSGNSSSDPADADLSLTQSYSINVKSTLSITASASSGELRIDAVDADGNTTTVFDETGPFNISDQQADLDPGSYTLNLYSNASGWSFRYSTR